MPNQFADKPILGWAVDSVEELKRIVDSKKGRGAFDRYLQSYSTSSLPLVERLFFESAYKLNFGGEKDKQKLITTDKPNGVFNFALASPTLYRLQEYYSEELAREQPDKFKDYNTVSGIVPPDLVRKVVINGVDTYLFTDALIGKDYNCVKQQKGTQEIQDGVPNSKLKFASKTKKVYQTYRRKGGKVKYVEIYSLTYYTSLDGDLQYAVRHIPAFMLAEYLESAGIKTRVYVTRFVQINNSFTLKGEYLGVPLPMAQTSLGRTFDSALVVQPVIVKDFQEEIDKNLFFAVGSESQTQFVESSVRNSYDKEITSPISAYGDPDWEQNEYWEGVERYRNKYEQYVKLGFFQSKEVLPEAMVFFHDMSIKKHFYKFSTSLIKLLPNLRTEIDRFLSLEANRFFSWWMKVSAMRVKHKINIMNSTAFRKDVDDIRKDLQEVRDELADMVTNASSPNWANLYTTYSALILASLKITDKPDSIWTYIQEITVESKYFAIGEMYGTPSERKKEIVENVTYILTEVQKVL